MICDDTDCKHRLDECYQWIFGVDGKGGALDCLDKIKNNLTHKVSVRFIITLLVLSFGSVTGASAWVWGLATNHESRLCIIEKQQKDAESMKKNVEAILEIVRKK